MSIRELAEKLMELVPDLQSATCEKIMQVLEQNNINHGGRMASIYSAKSMAFRLQIGNEAASSAAARPPKRPKAKKQAAAKRKESDRDHRLRDILPDAAAVESLWRVYDSGHVSIASVASEKQALLYCLRQQLQQQPQSLDTMLRLSVDELRQVYAGSASSYRYAQDKEFLSSAQLLRLLSQESTDCSTIELV